MNETHAFPYLDAGTRAVAAAFGDRLAPGILTWTDLFTDDAILEAKFDESTHPYQGRQSLAALARALAAVIRFEQVQVHEVIDATDERTVVYTSSAIFTRLDLGARYHRSYVSIAHWTAGESRTFASSVALCNGCSDHASVGGSPCDRTRAPTHSKFNEVAQASDRGSGGVRVLKQRKGHPTLNRYDRRFSSCVHSGRPAPPESIPH